MIVLVATGAPLARHAHRGVAVALSVLCEALATRRPMTVVPFVSRSLAGHPAWPRSLATLPGAGVRLVDPRTGGPWRDEPLEPGTGDTVAAAFDWRSCWDDVGRPS